MTSLREDTTMMFEKSSPKPSTPDYTSIIINKPQVKVGEMKKSLTVSVSDTTPTFYFKVPYIGPFSVVTQKRVRHFTERYCDNIDIK